ncbi:hypothetical protein RI129_005535 [Pyrocoelia pectoralis]|uniref:Uncharacterized protein n=1 Tax=Pyrocoelia pectoralis TaxID=417401 RepID=A0AAN7VL11_9COLE
MEVLKTGDALQFKLHLIERFDEPLSDFDYRHGFCNYIIHTIMQIKIKQEKLVLVSCFAVAYAQHHSGQGSYASINLGQHGTAHGHGHVGNQIDYYEQNWWNYNKKAHPKYEFNYGVADAHTHDHHSQHEIRDGDAVHGEYSLHEADGTIRTVKYTANDKDGFNAVVERTGHAAHPEGHAKVAVHHAPHHNYY